MKNESNKKFWDRVAKLYAPLMEKDKLFYGEICKNIRKYLNDDMDVLELACGSGQLSFELSRYSKSWLGTDFSERMISEARKRGNCRGLRFDVADATSLSFEEHKFDCVVIANALHIMPTPEKVMLEINRVLKPDGVLFAPTFLWTEGKSKKFIKTLMSIAGFKMYREWNKKQFCDFVESYGFSAVEMKLVYGGLAPVGVMIAKKTV
ncbi:MAG: methyltransferase domain-containing protein [Hornefia sp.]|nr:methyltransferase domain-containing protein [Hornefia sp.]